MNEYEVIPQETVEVVDVQFRPGQKIYFFDPAGHVCQKGQHVIIDTARGPEYGICASGNHRVTLRDIVAPLRPVLRLATAQDEKIAAENQAKEQWALQVSLEKVQEHQLDMQMVSAECAFDGSKILIFFTADGRVDFRELVKDLASVFHTRIELRQIGVRDKAKMVGGFGICGRPFCCTEFLDNFQTVSIKMAKTQNLSLNPTKISGTCGRLMCCLKYEQEAYEDLIRTSPKADSFVDTPDGRGTVVEVDLLRQRVKVKMELQPEVIGVYANADIVVLRSGKAKKTDLPIPDDLAPISGNKKVVKKETPEPKEGQPLLDSIRFRYSTETIADEQNAEPIDEPVEEAAEAVELVSEETQLKRSRRKVRKPHPESKQEKQEPEQPVQQEPQPEKLQEKAEQKPHRRRPPHRRRRPQGTGNSEPKE